jgi:hypothetical protein
MKGLINIRGIIIVASLVILSLFLGCKKKEPCKDVIQDDWELVE